MRYGLLRRGDEIIEIGTSRSGNLDSGGNVMPSRPSDAPGKNKDGKWIISIIVGFVITLIVEVTLGGFAIYVHGQITELTKKLESVCTMQMNQKENMNEQKKMTEQLINNHVTHIEKSMDYIRRDMDNVNSKMDRIFEYLIKKKGK